MPKFEASSRAKKHPVVFFIFTIYRCNLPQQSTQYGKFKLRVDAF